MGFNALNFYELQKYSENTENNQSFERPNHKNLVNLN